MQKILLTLLSCCSIALYAQFGTPAGEVGSTAIHADSNCFIDWGNTAHIIKGYMDISMPDSGTVDVGSAESACGPAKQNGVVSLGDSGVAVVQFFNAIIDGAGFDFAVFENAFNDTFLELAHVEISNDGETYYRFPSTSLTQYNKQLGTFDGINTEKIHNLAGKYRFPYGTPFDISELDSVYTDLPEEFYYVRITDVIGCINPKWASKDQLGNIINDPWPTPFISSGFDLDAVGMINGRITNCVNLQTHPSLYFYSINEETFIKSRESCTIEFYNNSGMLIEVISILNSGDTIPVKLQKSGVYYWKTEQYSGSIFIK